MADKNIEENKELESAKAAEPDFQDGDINAFRDDEDFDRKYRRAVAVTNIPTDRLLNDLSRESKADRYNFLGAFVPIILIIILSLSFILIGRGDIEELFEAKPSLKTIADGSYTQGLNSVYESTLPFKDGIKALGAFLGFCDKPVQPETPPTEDLPGSSQPEQSQPNTTPEPAVTEPAVTTAEPAITTVPSSTDEVLPDVTEETEPEEYETYTMYASATLNVRLGPSTEEAILGYYNQNDRVEVIEMLPNGWAAVLFDGHRAYAHGGYLSEDEVEVTTKKTRTEAVTTEESESSELGQNGEGDVTQPPEQSEAISEPLEDDEVVITEPTGGDIPQSSGGEQSEE